MDGDLDINSRGAPPSTGHLNDASAVDRSELPLACILCQRILSSNNEAGDLEAISICRDCKFLFLEEFGTPAEDTHRRRGTRIRRTRHSSSESVEVLFSHMINLARQSQSAAADHESQTADSDTAARFFHRIRSRTTPSGSRRWRRVPSDTESDGFDSLYGESESNISFSGHRLFQSESDAISFSAYGGNSDASVDEHSFLDTEFFNHPDGGSDLESSTDIDPMHAGLDRWDLDDDEEAEDSDWEEVDVEEDTDVLEELARLRMRARELTQAHIHSRFGNLDDPEVRTFAGNSGDYLGSRGFDELLEHLAESENLRRGAPPAAASFVNSLPRVIINKTLEKQDSLACAICQDLMSIGTVANQLPCFHLYHPSCILPWLRARNSCPVCRYVLPTDDKNYEERKRNPLRNLEIREIQQREMSEGSSSDSNDDADADASEVHESNHDARAERAGFVNEEDNTESSGRETARGRWIFLAAAPIVGLVGIALMLWLGNPRTERRGPTGRRHFPGRGQNLSHTSGSWPINQTENRSRRWWSLF